MSLLKRIAASDLPDSFFRPVPEDATEGAVRSIIADVRARGDDALRELAARFDSYSSPGFKVSPERIAQARAGMEEGEPELANAYRSAASNIRAFANRQMGQFVDFDLEPASGLLLGQRVQPIDAAGLYIPGGRYPLISTLLMTAIPAQVAEVPRIVLCSPPRRGEGPDRDLPDERILAVAGMLGLTEVYALGGAQAIAAMAIGTESVPRVDKVFGPGNRYVAAAKRMLYGEVGIDFIAGPTEVMVIADDSADPEWVAWDLLAQAEHDAAAIPVLPCLPGAPLAPSRPRWRGSSRACPPRPPRARLWRRAAWRSPAPTRRRPPRWPTARRPSTSSLPCAIPRPCKRSSATTARSSSGTRRRKPWEISRPASTTPCPRRARRATRGASPSRTS